MNTLTPTLTRPGPVLQRILLYPGEVYRVPQAIEHLHFASGQAWVSHRGQDIVLDADARLALPPKHEPALVSPLGPNPLVIELVGC